MVVETQVRVHISEQSLSCSSRGVTAGIAALMEERDVALGRVITPQMEKQG